MEVKIDRDGCIGCGMCAQTAPEIFTLDGMTAQVLCATVPLHAEHAARQAAAECPVNVIYVNDAP